MTKPKAREKLHFPTPAPSQFPARTIRKPRGGSEIPTSNLVQMRGEGNSHPGGIKENSQGVKVWRVQRARPKTPGKRSTLRPTPEAVADMAASQDGYGVLGRRNNVVPILTLSRREEAPDGYTLRVAGWEVR